MMWLFGKKKKKQQTNIDENGLIGYIKDNLENPTDDNVLKVLDNMTKPADDLTHLDENGDFPWGWHTANKNFTEKIQNEFTYFLNRWIDSRKESPSNQYEALKSFVVYMDDVKNLCESKGECFELWCNEVLIGKGYLEKRREELIKLQMNLDSLQNSHDKKVYELQGLEEKVLNKLIENDGILQSEFVKMFDSCIKSEVSKLLYDWNKEGRVQRIKSGRSYILHIEKGL